MNIYTGPEKYEILSSGTVITFNNEPLYFELESDIKFKMFFTNKPEIEGQRIEYTIAEGFLNMEMTNFNTSLGVGNQQPVQIATVNNRKIYLNFVVTALNEFSGKTIHYTWYSREEVSNG